MTNVTLTQVALFLAAAVVAAPLAKLLRIGNVLGYLLVGVLIGPFGLGFVYSVYEVSSILHFAEFGVVLLLFLIGLELRPRRLWAMRTAIFGLGGAQVAITALLLAVIAVVFGLTWPTALFAGLALSLSSTAFALQVLEEKGELALRHGRMAFAVLLFQDLAAIPLIALTPLFAVTTRGTAPPMEVLTALKAIGVILAVVVVGRYVLDGLIRIIARTRVKEAMTACALLTVVGVTLVMEQAGLSASLGAFIAGVLLADSDYRHEIQADIAPFEGLLLGLFFTAVGMSLNLRLVVDSPTLVLAIVVGLLAVKSAVLFVLGRRAGLESGPSRRLALAIAQGGEFAFVLFTTGAAAGVIEQPVADLLSVAVTLSMAATPLLLLIDEMLTPKAAVPAPSMPCRRTTVMSSSPGSVASARSWRASCLPRRSPSPRSIPTPSTSMRCASSGPAPSTATPAGPRSWTPRRRPRRAPSCWPSTMSRPRSAPRRWSSSATPHVPIYARSRHRRHTHQLMDLGIEVIRRETFLSSLDLTREVLRGLGLSERDVRFAVDTFRAADRRRLYEDYKHYTDLEKLQERAKSHTQELEGIFAQDAAEQAGAGKEKAIIPTPRLRGEG